MVKNLHNLDSVRVQVNQRRRLHSIIDHNFWINRIGVCPYCKDGSVPVTKSEIRELLDK